MGDGTPLEEAAQTEEQTATPTTEEVKPEEQVTEPTGEVETELPEKTASSRFERRTEKLIDTLKERTDEASELRKQLEEVADGLAEFNDEKSKKLYLKDRLQGMKVLRKRPPVPADEAGGLDVSKLTEDELIERGLKKMNQRK